MGRTLYAASTHPCHTVRVNGSRLDGWILADVNLGIAYCFALDSEDRAVMEEDGHAKLVSYRGIITVEPPGDGR